MTPTPSSIIPSPPSREKLELQLANGEDLVESVQRSIDRWKLPFVIEISDGTKEHNGKVVPKGWGILRDTLCQGELHLQTFITIEESTVAMKEDARKMYRTPYEVLIRGATGTGKEIIAKSMIGDRKGEIKAFIS